MSQPTLFYKSATRKVTIMAAIAMVGLTALVSTFFLSADFAPESYALDSAVGLESEVTATVDGTHYVSLTASDVNFSASPTGSTPVTDKQTVNVSVETNVTGGASLYLASTTNTNALYKDGNPANSNLPHIAASTATVDSPITLDNLATNTWAYSTDNTNYQGVPTSSDTHGPNLIADINGTTTGTTSGGVTSATIPIYYAAKIDTSIPAGSYASSVTYSAVVDGGIVTSAELTSITVDGNQTTSPSAVFQAETENIILITTNLKTNTYGTPRVYYTATDPSGYQECGNVVVGSNAEGYMTVTCTVTPTTEATGVTLHIVPKGEPTTGSAANNNLTGDPFCTDGTYNQGTSECESGEWKWGSFMVALPDITPPPTIMSEISTMQEMTPEFCASVTDKAPGNTARLQDVRDGKYYWVAKLKDGNCWMTQNLELDLTAGVELTPDTSDVSANWDPGATTLDTAQTGSTSYIAVQSWNLGKVVWKTPDSTVGCSGYDVYDFTNSTCQAYWQDVSTWAHMTEYRTDGVTYDADTQTYDAHYLAGNYYSYVAATAGSGASVTTRGEKAPDSICPAGWELPTSYSTYNSTPGSFYNLLNQYGLTSSPTSGDNNIVKAPLFFVRAGCVTPIGHYLYDSAFSGRYWSSVASSSSHAYPLDFLSSGPMRMSNDYKYSGRSVRCVAPSA